jgi:hypothetical protein
MIASRHRTGVRWLWAVVATLQLLLPGAVALADALLEARASRQAVAHIEGHTSAQCTPAHSPDCALCRYLDGTGPQPHASVAQVVVSVHAIATPRSEADWTTATRIGSIQPRAPPLA